MITRKAFIEERLRAGRSPWNAWHDFEAAHPGRACGWLYVLKIAANLKLTMAKEAACIDVRTE